MMSEKGKLGPKVGHAVPTEGMATARILINKGKRYAAKYLRDECLRTLPSQDLDDPHVKVLPDLLDILLNPTLSLINWDAIDWIKWLMAAGGTPDEFFMTVRRYDTATTCGLVWMPDFVAYRCRTCGISPCMSLCAQCFQDGNHDGHDYNMFKSQAGGACDCGNPAVMRETGFCQRHGRLSGLKRSVEVPMDLLALAEAIMPRLFLRFILHCRNHSNLPLKEIHTAMEEASLLLELLQDLSCLGAAMRSTMTKTLCNPKIYVNLTEPSPGQNHYDCMLSSKNQYERAVKSIPFEDVPQRYNDIPTLVDPLYHTTFLEEIVFWTVKFEFPQKFVCLLLNMRPDAEYETAFAKAFVHHYSRISLMLVQSDESDSLGQRVVHVSVQLFSDENLAFRMTDAFHLLHVMVVSLKKMIKKICVQSELSGPDRKYHHLVVNCGHQVMKSHCYWPLVSDLNNILSHRPIAEKFMSDPRLIEEWFSFLSLFQGMNLNTRELLQHVEYEPQHYYAAFSAELEAIASPMWALISHLKDVESRRHTQALIRQSLRALSRWFRDIQFVTPDVMREPDKVSFHLPLHRNFAVFLCQAVKNQGAHLEDLLPPKEFIQLLMIHPLRVQVAFYEILNGMWMLNGLQIKGQAMTYIQCHFCNSMVDADLFLMQIGAAELPPNSFFSTIFERFPISNTMLLSSEGIQHGISIADNDHAIPMLESFLTFIATLTTVRTNLGLSEERLSRLEMISLLCMSNKTHSQLIESMPERCANGPHKNFESILKEVSMYRGPNCEASGAMQQGMYVPKSNVWKELYDPIYVLLRAVQRKDYQNSMERFKQFCKKDTGANSSSQGDGPLWPPYRIPAAVSSMFKDPRNLLGCRTFHGALVILLYKALHDGAFTESLLSITVYLMEMAVEYRASSENKGAGLMTAQHQQKEGSMCEMGQFGYFFQNWFKSDDIFHNAVSFLLSVPVNRPMPSSSTSSESDDSEMEMVELEGGGMHLALTSASTSSIVHSSANHQLRPLVSGSEVVPYHADASAIVPMDTDVSEMMPRLLPLNGEEPTMALVPSAGMPEISDDSSPEIDQVSIEGRPIYPSLLSGTEISRVTNIQPHHDYSVGISNQALDLSQMSSNSIPNRALPSPELLQDETQNAGDDMLNLNESLISLLIKLHTKLSGKPSYRPNFSLPASDDRIGDGPFFIAKLLNKLGHYDERCANCIRNTLRQLYPSENVSPPLSVDAEKLHEEKKRKARERQRKVMADFAHRQKQFLQRNMEECEAGPSNEVPMNVQTEEKVKTGSSKSRIGFKEYDCVICNQSIPSTSERPVGMVVLLQATSIVGHRSSNQTPHQIPTSEHERYELRRTKRTLAEFMEDKADTLKRHFEMNSWLVSMNIGWEGGVHVQTCGHHLHLDCHQSYLLSLRSSHRHTNINNEKGEYLCPFCRQLANSVLPISPEIGDYTSLAKTKTKDGDVLEIEIDNMIKELSLPRHNQSMQAMSQLMESLTVATYGKYRTMSTSPSSAHTPSTFLFVSSILRTNLEVELVQRGISLVSQGVDAKGDVKRSCLRPLIHVLAFHMKILSLSSDSPQPPIGGGIHWTRQLWSSLCQRPVGGCEGALVPPQERDVPMLFRDPITILVQMVLLLPSKLDQAYFDCVVLKIYRLVVIRASVSALRLLSESQRVAATSWGAETSLPLGPLLGLAFSTLKDSPFFCDDQPPSMVGDASHSQDWSIDDIACEVRETCIEFLRIAAILKSHILEENLPIIIDPLAECGALERYLGLWDDCSVVNTAVMGKMCGSLNTGISLSPSTPPAACSSTSILSLVSSIPPISDLPSPVETHKGTLALAGRAWCLQLVQFASQAQVAAAALMKTARFSQARLLKLPRLYGSIFQYYHRKPCQQCNSVPDDPCVCLLCAALVCMRSECCKQQEVCEMVQHAIDCGAGTGIYLHITQSTIIVIRGPRVCLWGCIHLDSYGEEDRDLKRGKPLYLSETRYNLLEQQWLSHGFDHTSHRWIWHRDIF